MDFTLTFIKHQISLANLTDSQYDKVILQPIFHM